jgi:hypothetical protein
MTVKAIKNPITRPNILERVEGRPPEVGDAASIIIILAITEPPSLSE